MNILEIVLTRPDGFTSVLDINDSKYRLTRESYRISRSNLKKLGGTHSTPITLGSTERNNLFFGGKNVGSTYRKWVSTRFDATLTAGGTIIGQGKFQLSGTTKKGFTGRFIDGDVDWVNDLGNKKLQETGYVDGEPTWFMPFDGVRTFNLVNDLNNRQTDMVFPTISYNNVPLTDYLDMNDNKIWGNFFDDNGTNVRETDAFSVNDFPCYTADWRSRLGVNMQDFPGAPYLRNVIEKIFEGINFSVECSLFGQDDFNSVVLPHTGDAFVWNYKHLAEAAADTLFGTGSISAGNSPDDTLSIVTDAQLNNVEDCIIDEPPLFNSAAGWAEDTESILVGGSIIYNDTPNTATYIDRSNSLKPFGNEDQYICPTSGRYTIKANGSFSMSRTNFLEEDDAFARYYDGSVLMDYYGTIASAPNQDYGTPLIDRPYGWDDNIMVILRKSPGNSDVYANTFKWLNRWMSNTDSTFRGNDPNFVDSPSDVIAVFSPKRQYHKDNVDINFPDNQIKRSPIQNDVRDVIVNSYSHGIDVDNSTNKESTSACSIEVTVDLKVNERIEILWVSMASIYYKRKHTNTVGVPSYPDGSPITSNFNGDYEVGAGSFSVDFECGTEDIDIARNLPKMNQKDLINSFVKLYNLHYTTNDSSISFIPIKQYYTDSGDAYDITARVNPDSEAWDPISEIPSKWTIGYDNDQSDRLLNDVNDNCDGSIEDTVSEYGNKVIINNDADTVNEVTERVKFSPTRFTDGKFELVDRGVVGIQFPLSGPDPSGSVFDPIIIGKGILFGNTPTGFAFESLTYDVPSIQSSDSYDQLTLGDLSYTYDYTPRLMYHLGTVNQYANILDNYELLVGAPRPIDGFVRLLDFWMRPTVSQFDGENKDLTGIDYMSLRFDVEGGIYDLFHENLVELYTDSGITTVLMNMRSGDWVNMRPDRLVRYDSQVYRLLTINKYDPTEAAVCQLKLIKTI